MLRFLFRDKKDKSEENPSGNLWIYGLGEFILVFLGILIALQVENWNQDRQDRKLEHVLLSEMLFNFIYDHFYPALRENLHTVIPRKMTIPVSLENLRQNNSFMEDLNMNIFIYRLSLRAYQMASEDIISLIADIEQELKE